MKKIKCFFAVLLALALFVSAVPLTASALSPVNDSAVYEDSVLADQSAELTFSDSGITETQAGLLLSQVDQTKEDYAETDAFAEYLDLIDQTPAGEEPIEEEQTDPAPAPQTFLAKLLGIMQKIIIFLRSMFPKI